jgi:hypothetical protein
MLKSEAVKGVKLVGFEDIKKNPIQDWPEYLQEGREFLATAQNAHTKGRTVFTPEILYNLVAMSIEKLIMAMLMQSGNLPYNHTMHDLVDSMEDFLPGELKSLGDELKALDAFQEICDKDNITIIIPTLAEVVKMLGLAKQMETLTLDLTAA